MADRTGEAERLLEQVARDALTARDAGDRDGYEAAVRQARQIMDNPLSYQEGDDDDR